MITVNKDSVTVEATNLDAFVDPQELRELQRQLEGLRYDIQSLEIYCENKRIAMDCRVGGEIRLAKKHEKTCEALYADRIPAWAKW